MSTPKNGGRETDQAVRGDLSQWELFKWLSLPDEHRLAGKKQSD
jgi:hypothetical protein